MAALRFDFVFSYWIYVWFIIYFFNYTKYSPKFALILGLLDNIVMLFLMIVWSTSLKTIIWFIIINILIKVVPLYYLRNELFKMKDIYVTIGLFLIFNSYNFRKKNNAIIKFNSGSQSISDKNILENLLNKYVYINNYFCDNKLKDYIQDSICKYDLNKFSKFTNYKQAEIMINILYKSNSIICMNIIEFYDLKKQYIQ
jgi:hypothetical protein